jgi:hypothetical protein
MRFMLILIISLYLAACATSNQNAQRPAPHNDFTGKFVEKHFAGEDTNDYMMRACKIYGGLNQDSIQKKDSDLLLQDIFEFKCNFANKLSDELKIDGKSSKRLNGTVAKQKCEKLGFKVGSKDFANCLQELTQ